MSLVLIVNICNHVVHISNIIISIKIQLSIINLSNLFIKVTTNLIILWEHHRDFQCIIDGGWFQRTFQDNNNTGKIINIPMIRFLNIRIHRGLVKK